MKDFRYHLVSLASVFLALAIGVVLGAGPLQSTLQSALSGQVGDLKTQNQSLEQQLGVAHEQNELDQKYLKALAQSSNQGMLNGLSVGLVLLPGVVDAQVKDVTDTLTAAGAKVTGQVKLKDAAFQQPYQQYRSSLAPQLGQYLASTPEPTASAETILGKAVLTILEKGAEPSATLKQILAAPENPIAEVLQATGGTQAIVVITPPQQKATADSTQNQAASPEAAQNLTEDAQNLAEFLNALGTAPKSAVVLGSAVDDQQLLTHLRDTSLQLTTIDNCPSASCDASLPPALLTADNSARHFGSQQGATNVMPSRIK
ncbi:hypothetical protein BSR29_03980 [Boudabousia liubingyangii]|uniref:Copper transporter n=1 Tax=Boudabousia liubingyangii TaxID=1921764 RepID=A0A1Q5PN99_9ACTO|nr:copper transporter [Boudabousia liubingyangii]OKL47578.1 hypothetical protein BSR28_03550 [Boudabousia liubingyangii]OKL49002.1 hypothetical protein BSR29_03980 [Boudabousia liubingyangii]